MAYPATLDSFTDPVSPTKLNSPAHDAQHSGVNNAAEALEAKVGINGSAVTTSHDYKLSGVTGSDKAVSKTGTETLTNKTLDEPLLLGSYPYLTQYRSGLAKQSNFVFVDTNSVRGVLVGDRIKWTQSSTVKYGTIISFPTSKTIEIATNNDYSISATAISDIYISPFSTTPSHFHYTPTITYVGGTTDPTSNTINHAYFSVLGQTCFFYIKSTIVRGGGDRVWVEYTLPIAKANPDIVPCSAVSSWGASTTVQPLCYAGATIVTVNNTMTGDGYTAISGHYLIA